MSGRIAWGFWVVAALLSGGALAQTVALPGHVAAWAQPDNDAGPVPAGLPLQHLTVLLQRTPAQQQAFEQLLQAQQTPGSPQYHHWLTPQQIGQRFGASQQNITAVTGWLQSQGLHVDGISNSRTRIIYSGSAAAVGKALGTEFHYYNVAQSVQGQLQTERRLSVQSEPQIPGSLVGVVSGFTGLSQHHLRPSKSCPCQRCLNFPIAVEAPSVRVSSILCLRISRTYMTSIPSTALASTEQAKRLHLSDAHSSRPATSMNTRNT